MAADEQSARVDEGNWYKASLPKIPATDKGKAPLEIVDPIKGNPAKEQFSLIVAYIDVLVQLRAEVIDEVDRFFNSFSFKKLPHLKIEEISAKEALILSWAETDYAGDGSSATDLKFLEWLSDLHMFVLEELKEQTLAHGLSWENTCCSRLFEGRSHDRGAVIARSNTNFRSSFWIRMMIKVDGSWVIELCMDFWKPLPRPVVCTEVPRQLSYVDTLPPVSDFFKVMKKQWTDVCMEVAKFFVSKKLLPVGSLNFYRDLSIVESVPAFELRRPNVTSWGWFQLGTASFSVCNEDDQMDMDHRSDSPDLSHDSSMHFVEDDIHLEDDSAPDQFIPPSFATTISSSLAALRESFSNLVANQSRDFQKTSDAHSEVMCKINHVERVFLDSLAEKNETFRGLFKRSRQEAQNDNNALSLALKAVRTQNAILSTDIAVTQKEVKDIQVALSKDFDDKLADIRNELLDFRIETQGQLASLGTHLAELIAFLTKDSDEKKGEDSSSRRPQPPPDDQNRPGGGSSSRPDDQRRYGGVSVSRDVGTRGSGSESQRRGDKSGSKRK
ncbi:hypothetical protein F511_40517 [Dorcoceras hygrometricum]|uniref:Uncharacterized protein n=1 Tax=Dorcoceras hygrometricum TaxID=472368 RepID=A0A2Z7BWT1_9LAMI|nr:hypothetical protein F511_40517 [Dorcoceras hygrometricum]